MRNHADLESLRPLLQRAGLRLEDGELESLLKGVNRSLRQAAELRELFAADAEPAVLFAASRQPGK